MTSSSFRYVCPELNIKLEFSVFLFNSTDKLVVTDVDGTITQSDIKVQANLLIEGHERFKKMFNEDKQIVSNNNFNLSSNQIFFLSGSRSPPNRAHSSPGWRGRAFPQTVWARLQDNLSHCQVISSINCYKTTKADNNNAGPVPWMMEQRRILTSCKRFVILFILCKSNWLRADAPFTKWQQR